MIAYRKRTQNARGGFKTRISLAAALVAALATAGAQAVTGTWTGGGAGLWDTSATNWSGVAGTPWDSTNGPTNLALFATVGDMATPFGTIFPGTIQFSESATVIGGSGSISFENLTAGKSIIVDPTKIGTIGADFLEGGVPVAGGDGNRIFLTGGGLLHLTGNTVLVGDLNQNLNAGFTVEGASHLQISAGVKAASTLQSNRGNFDSAVGTTSADNTLTIDGAYGTSVYIGGLLVGANRTGNDTFDGSFGGNEVYVTRPGDSTTASLIIAGNGKALVVGGDSANNYVEFSNGAYVRSQQGGGTNSWVIGHGVNADNNAMLVTGAGTQFDSGSNATIDVGRAGDGNSLTISAGAKFENRKLGIGTQGGNNNFVLITGAGSEFTGDLVGTGQNNFGIGSDQRFSTANTLAGSGNYLQIDNGGAFYMVTTNSRGYNIGAVTGADNNYVLVTGVGSSFTLRAGQPLSIGGTAGTNNNNHVIVDSLGNGNHVDIFSGATASQATVYVMGVGSAVNLGDGVGVSVMEVRHSNANALYGAGVVLYNADARLNMDSGRLNAGVIPGTDLKLVSGPGKVDLVGTGYFNVDSSLDAVNTSRQITSEITGSGDFHKEGDGLLQLTLANTYTGDTYVDGGILQLDQTYLDDAADVIIAVSAMMDLVFGGTDTINALSLGGVGQAPGTYGSTSSAATNQNDTYFSGTGVLNVLTGPAPVPAPAALPAGLALLTLASLRRRRRQA